MPTILYACETWNSTELLEKRLNVTEMRWLRSILGFRLTDCISNYNIRLICGGIPELSRQLENIRLRYYGHIRRMELYDQENLAYKMYKWVKPAHWGPSRRGRPITQWSSTCLNRSLAKLGLDGVSN